MQDPRRNGLTTESLGWRVCDAQSTETREDEERVGGGVNVPNTKPTSTRSGTQKRQSWWG